MSSCIPTECPERCCFDNTLWKCLTPPFVCAATLSVAARILAVEAYHAGIIRDQLYELDYTGNTLPYGLTVTAVVQAISNLRDAVDGPDDLDQGILAKGGMSLTESTLVPTDANGLTFLRDVSQVLAIVYLGAADAPGGFFPEGINGRFGPVRYSPFAVLSLPLPCPPDVFDCEMPKVELQLLLIGCRMLKDLAVIPDRALFCMHDLVCLV